jgi:hypothetical protein
MYAQREEAGNLAIEQTTLAGQIVTFMVHRDVACAHSRYFMRKEKDEYFPVWFKSVPSTVAQHVNITHGQEFCAASIDFSQEARWVSEVEIRAMIAFLYRGD